MQIWLHQLKTVPRWFWVQVIVVMVLCGVLANSELDQILFDQIQARFRSAHLDVFLRAIKAFGGPMTIFIFVLLAVLPWRHVLRFWAIQGLQVNLVGGSLMLLLQLVTGGSRPGELPWPRSSSAWSFFADNNGVSAHAFLGAIPFLLLSHLCRWPWGQLGLFLASMLCAWSRVNDRSHFLSQALLGWFLCYWTCCWVKRHPWPPMHWKGTKTLGHHELWGAMLGTTILSALVLLLLGGTLGQDAHAMWLEVHKGIDAHLPVLPTLGMRLFIKRAGEENVLSLNMGALMLMLYTQLSLYVLSLKMFYSKVKALRMLLFFGCSPWVVSFGLLYRVHAMVPLLLVWVTYGFWAVLHSGFKSWSSLWLAISLGLLVSSVRLDQVEELSLMVLSLSIAGLLSAKDTKVLARRGNCCLRAYGFVMVCCTVLMMSSPWLPWLSSNWTIKYPIP